MNTPHIYEPSNEEKQAAEIESLKKILAVYANKANWQTGPNGWQSFWANGYNGFDIARIALNLDGDK